MSTNGAEEQPHSCAWRNEKRHTRHEMQLVVGRVHALNEVNKS